MNRKHCCNRIRAFQPCLWKEVEATDAGPTVWVGRRCRSNVGIVGSAGHEQNEAAANSRDACSEFHSYKQDKTASSFCIIYVMFVGILPPCKSV